MAERDHGYSEAVYLEDLESNGIELNRDKPVNEWDIREEVELLESQKSCLRKKSMN